MQYTIQQAKPVSQQTADSIRAMILAGDVSDGSQINEVHMASALAVSRTPVREGLQQLVAEHFVEVKPRRGFFVRLLTPEEFSDLYDMRPLLDPHALLIGGLPSAEQIGQIDAAHDAFMAADNAVDKVTADEHFHRCLISACGNQVLLATIDNLMLRTRRYELALFRETQPVLMATNEHEHIIDALQAGNLDDAANALRVNLTSGKQPILDWLSQRA